MGCRRAFFSLVLLAVSGLPVLAQVPIFDGGAVGINQGKLQRFQLVWQASFADQRPYAYDLTSYDFTDTFGPDGARLLNPNATRPVIWVSGTGYSTNGKVAATLDISCPLLVQPGLYERQLPMRVGGVVVCNFRVRVQVYPKTTSGDLAPSTPLGEVEITLPPALPAPPAGTAGVVSPTPPRQMFLSRLLRGPGLGDWIRTRVRVGGVEYTNSYKGPNIAGTGLFNLSELATSGTTPGQFTALLAVTDETDPGRVYVLQVQLDNQPATVYRVSRQQPQTLNLSLVGVNRVSISAKLLRGYASGAATGPVLLEPKIIFRYPQATGAAEDEV